MKTKHTVALIAAMVFFCLQSPERSQAQGPGLPPTPQNLQWRYDDPKNPAKGGRLYQYIPAIKQWVPHAAPIRAPGKSTKNTTIQGDGWQYCYNPKNKNGYGAPYVEAPRPQAVYEDENWYGKKLKQDSPYYQFLLHAESQGWIPPTTPQRLFDAMNSEKVIESRALDPRKRHIVSIIHYYYDTSRKHWMSGWFLIDMYNRWVGFEYTLIGKSSPDGKQINLTGKNYEASKGSMEGTFIVSQDSYRSDALGNRRATRLIGLSKTNSSAMARGVVIHAMAGNFAGAPAKGVYSSGCPALPQVSDHYFQEFSKGTVLVADDFKIPASNPPQSFSTFYYQGARR